LVALASAVTAAIVSSEAVCCGRRNADPDWLELPRFALPEDHNPHGALHSVNIGLKAPPVGFLASFLSRIS
jgi:hypothetical protein